MVYLNKSYRPNIIFLSKTRQNKEYVESLRYRLGMKSVFTVSVKGKGGGLAVFWDECFTMELNKFGEHFIDMYISNSDGSKWRCTFVYGEPKASQRYVMWEHQRRVKSLGFGPLFLVGDFNEVMWQHEHFSRHKRSSKLMANFREILSECNLFDLRFHGLPWTYDNKQEGNRNVKVRLDRAVACPQWSAMYPHCKVSHIISSRSDHYPLYIQLLGNRPNVSVNKHLRYESYWERECLALDGQIKACRNKGSHVEDLEDVANNLDRLMKPFHGWSQFMSDISLKNLIGLVTD